MLVDRKHDTSGAGRLTHMTRRSFVSAAAMASGMAVLTGLAACGAGSSPSEDGPASAPTETTDNAEEAPASTDETRAQAPAVYFTHSVVPETLQAVFDAIGEGLSGKVGVKLSTGEPGGNHYLKADLISGLVSAVGGTIVECNTAYGGLRGSTEAHYQVAADHGFTSIADFQIMDEDGSLSLPVERGLHLSENLVGAHFADYDGFLVLSHFKGHAMAGFGGALKNISIGMASREGKLLIHSAGQNRTSWSSAATPDFLESMADACKAVLASQPNMLIVTPTRRRQRWQTSASWRPQTRWRLTRRASTWSMRATTTAPTSSRASRASTGCTCSRRPSGSASGAVRTSSWR